MNENIKHIYYNHSEGASLSDILLDEQYLMNNMGLMHIGLEHFSLMFLDNLLLVTEYFKAPRNVSDYKFIKQEFLENMTFINMVIPSNPEIYFYMPDKYKPLFKKRLIDNCPEYLKYLDRGDFNSPEILKKVMRNLTDLKHSLEIIKPEVFNATSLAGHNGEFDNKILSLSLSNCKRLQVPLQGFMEKYEEIYSKSNLNKRGVSPGLTHNLDANPNLYTILDKESPLHSKLEPLMVAIVGRHNDLFKYMPESFRNDEKIVLEIINNNDPRRKGHCMANGARHENVKDISYILNEIENPARLIEDNRDNIDFKKIRDTYHNLCEEVRSSETVIRSLFVRRDVFQIKEKYLESIPYEKLRDLLLEQLSLTPVFFDRNLKVMGDSLERVVNYYYMNERLGEISKGGSNNRDNSNAGSARSNKGITIKEKINKI